MTVLAGGLVVALIAACSPNGSGPATDDSTAKTDNLEFSAGEYPAAVKVGVTYEGPVYTNTEGMTIYTSRTGRAGRSECLVTWENEDPNAHPLLMVYLDYPAPKCTEQWPPLIAEKDAKAVGRWSTIARPEGRMQWAYDDYPVYTSYLDFLPGDVNGAGAVVGAVGAGEGRLWSTVSPPMITPPGVTLVKRGGVGLVAMFQGRALYTLPAGTDTAGLEKWRPLAAAEIANPIGSWSINTSSEGAKHWTRGGLPVYLYRGDTGPTELRGWGQDQALPVVIYPLPPPPAESDIGIGRTLLGPSYTTADGLTLYTFDCSIRAPGTSDLTGDAYICRNWNDDPAQREQFCAAPDRCAEMWQPQRAPADAQPHGGAWSVAIIPDPKYPLRWLIPKGSEPLDSASGAIKVWTFKGRPMFAFTEDREPGDITGHQVHQSSGQHFKVALAGDLEN